MTDAALPVSMTTAEIRQGWADLLCRYTWDVFGTHTYRDPVRASEKVERDVVRWLREWCCVAAEHLGLARHERKEKRDAYGRVIAVRSRWRGPFVNGLKRNSPDCRSVFVVGVEQHRSGLLHAHTLVRLPGLLAADMRREDGWRMWKDMFGFGRFEPPSNQDDVAGYVSKYVVKGGELVLSPTFTAQSMQAG